MNDATNINALDEYLYHTIKNKWLNLQHHLFAMIHERKKKERHDNLNKITYN